MQISSIALAGMGAAVEKVENASRRLANPETSGDLVDLSADMVALMEAKHQYTANIKAFETADEMERQVLDLLA